MKQKLYEMVKQLSGESDILKRNELHFQIDLLRKQINENSHKEKIQQIYNSNQKAK